MSAAPSAPGSYLVPSAPAQGEVRDRGSRFVASIVPCTSDQEVKAHLAALARRHPDATHLCWACRLGFPARERSADAGEPAGTAGAPILAALRGAAVTDVLAVVARWFGGTKLGKGGLIRAYAAATAAALEGLATTVRVPTVELELELPLARLGAVKRLVHPPEVELVGERYGAVATLRLAVQRPQLAALRAVLADLGIAPQEREQP